nr:MAG TPA: hypothetical protein [Caudoviricetes sp.]
MRIIIITIYSHIQMILIAVFCAIADILLCL